jgi:leukotriene-A4 hydrolase
MPAHKLALKGAATERIIPATLLEEIARNSLTLPPPQRHEVGHGVPALYVDGVLTPDECRSICQAMDAEEQGAGGALSFWSELGRDNEAARAFRDADTVEVQLPALATMLWERLQRALLPTDLVPLTFPDTEPEANDDHFGWERELPGTWQPGTVNHDFLFVRYPPGGAFAPHSDGRAVHDFNTRSHYSVVLFLNDIPEGLGGGTSFYVADAVKRLVPATPGGRWTADPALVLTTVHPRAGRFLMFRQTLIHEGVPPVAPHCKYIIRSDIMYERSPKICDQPGDIEAYRLFREAESLSEEGQHEVAVKMFQRAFKMSPAFAKIMGQL